MGTTRNPQGTPGDLTDLPSPQDLQMNPGGAQAPKQSPICAPPPPSLGAQAPELICLRDLLVQSWSR